ncbi:MAG: copper ion binding protein [Desulfomonilaceae bacterium]
MKTTVKVKGMSCNHCVMAVSKALNQIDGVSDVQVDLEKGEATLEHGTTVEMAQIKQQIEKAGYQLG